VDLSRFKVQDSRFKVQDLRFKVQDAVVAYFGICLSIKQLSPSEKNFLHENPRQSVKSAGNSFK